MNLEMYRQFLNFCFVYLTALFGRSVLCSYLILLLVLLLRQTALKRAVFFKGFLWSLFVLAPFVGKLKLFYENPFRKVYHLAQTWQGAGHMAVYPAAALNFLIKMFYQWGNFCVEQPWICRIYLLGVLGSFLVLCRQRRKRKWLFSQKALYREEPCWLRREFGRKTLLGRIPVRVSEWKMTPCSAGLLHPEIILPRVAIDHCSKEETELMILHEKIHIRLGHLWFYFLWDLLRCLLWPNPFLTLCTGYFRQDLEDICDRVTIQQSKKQPCEYGKLLLKTAQLLQEGQMMSTLAFAGERGYREFRRRICNIMAFRPYRQAGAVCLSGICLLALTGMLTVVFYSSYPRYTELDQYILVNAQGNKVLINDSEALKQAVSRDRQNVYIEPEAMEALLAEYGIWERTFYLGFGGFMKLPGMGGGGCCVFVDCRECQDDLVIPYEEQKDLLSSILKVL